MNYRLGVDIGGTFTDAMVVDERSGDVYIDKVPSTPKDPSIGFLAATDRILSRNGISAADVNYVVHGTTVATNAIIEGKTARTAFVTTDGFRDLLEIARQSKPTLYDLQFEKPKPMVPRHLCFGVPERLDARGNVVAPINEDAVRDIARSLRDAGVESIAVCLLHAHINPAHEAIVGKIFSEELPGIRVSLSSEVAPEFREYFRASTTVINASIRPVVESYLTSIENRLRAEGLSGDLLVMQSNGGVQSFAGASERPVFMVESGPAAGVVAATHLGTILGFKDVIALDMGGTTAKVGLVLDGSPRVTKDYEVGGAAMAGTGRSRGSGYPIRTPVIDLVEIGAGGGSIAWVDSGGALRVGPQSAGADPGPACYGWGGVEPTVTDANLVLGRLNPAYFLRGEIKLDVEKATKAVDQAVARPLGLSVVEAAHGILQIADAAMVSALRLISIKRGYDPRDFVLVAFGGAGPVHSGRLAIELGIPRTVVPLSPGIFSAMGLLVTDLRHDFSRTVLLNVEGLDAEGLERTFADLQAAGRSVFEQEGMATADTAFIRYAEMRYVGQSYELTIPLPPGQLTAETLRQLVEEFHKDHERTYGFSVLTEPTEIVNVRLSAVGRITRPKLRTVAQDGDAAAALKETRPVYFEESGGYVDCPVYDRYLLGEGATVVGPAVVEEPDSTTIVHPGYRVAVDGFGNLLNTI
jgi:N-methylhydantoinase A